MNAASANGHAPDDRPTDAPAPADTASSRATAHVIALGELPDLAPSGERVLADTGNPLHQVKLQLRVSVGEIAMTIGELMAAQQQQVFVLDRGVEQPVDVLLDGRVVARGQLVAVDDRFAVRITQLPAPLNA